MTEVGGFTAHPGIEGSGFILDDNGVVRKIKRAFANASALGNTQIVAGVAGKKIRVLSALWIGTAAATVKFQSNTTDISAGFPSGATGGAVMPQASHGWFETAAGEALNINLSVATPTGVQVVYIEV